MTSDSSLHIKENTKVKKVSFSVQGSWKSLIPPVVLPCQKEKMRLCAVWWEVTMSTFSGQGNLIFLIIPIKCYFNNFIELFIIKVHEHGYIIDQCCMHLQYGLHRLLWAHNIALCALNMCQIMEYCKHWFYNTGPVEFHANSFAACMRPRQMASTFHNLLFCRRKDFKIIKPK